MIGLLVLAATCCAAQNPATEEAHTKVSAAVTEYRAQADRVIDGGLEYLIATQSRNGSWSSWQEPMIYDRHWSNPETHLAWQYAVTGLVCLSLMEVEDHPRAAAALNGGLDFLTAAPLIKRVSDWDTDNTWAYVYGLAALAKAAKDPRFNNGMRKVAIEVRGRKLLAQLNSYQSPNGGWGYYDDEATTSPPQWGTSFMTGVAVLALLDAKELGWKMSDKVLPASIAAIEHCRLPDGSYTYSVRPIPIQDAGIGIDQVRGSLSRIQVCNWALYQAGKAGFETSIGMAELRSGLALLFQEHHYLDIARGRPYPHEAYHYNSGYFYFFGHYYAGFALAELGSAGAEDFYGALQHEIGKTQSKDGSMIDFFMNSYGKPYGTAYGIGALLEANKVFTP
ncbi:MAG: hypothetical protein GY879_09850 [Planctomycetes bacterium]|nr:hypothetical protein [Planctomycetota bacterium]